MSVFVKIVHFVIDNFFILCLVLGMDIAFSKTTAHKLGETPGGHYAKNPRWPPLETEEAISWLLLALQPCVIPNKQIMYVKYMFHFFPHHSVHWWHLIVICLPLTHSSYNWLFALFI